MFLFFFIAIHMIPKWLNDYLKPIKYFCSIRHFYILWLVLFWMYFFVMLSIFFALICDYVKCFYVIECFLRMCCLPCSEWLRVTQRFRDDKNNTYIFIYSFSIIYPNAIILLWNMPAFNWWMRYFRFTSAVFNTWHFIL